MFPESAGIRACYPARRPRSPVTIEPGGSAALQAKRVTPYPSEGRTSPSACIPVHGKLRLDPDALWMPVAPVRTPKSRVPQTPLRFINQWRGSPVARLPVGDVKLVRSCQLRQRPAQALPAGVARAQRRQTYPSRIQWGTRRGIYVRAAPHQVVVRNDRRSGN